MDRWKKAIGLVVVLAVTLVATEALLRVGLGVVVRHGPAPYRSEHLRRLAFAYRYADEQGGAAGPERAWTHDERRGHKPAPNLDGFVAPPPALPARITTDAQGARGTVRVPLARTPGTSRIVALGDSFTFGDGVDDDQAWPAQVAARRPGIEVVNLGASGYAQDQMLLTLEDDGLRYAPDLVLAGFVAADIERNTARFYYFEKPRFERRGDTWTLTNVPVPSPEQLAARVTHRPLLFELVRALLGGLAPLPARAEQLALSRTLIERMAELSASKGARFGLVYLPLLAEARGEASDAHDLFVELCRTPAWTCADSLAAFRAEARAHPADFATRYFLPDGHYTPDGHRLAAGVVAKALPSR